MVLTTALQKHHHHSPEASSGPPNNAVCCDFGVSLSHNISKMKSDLEKTDEAYVAYRYRHVALSFVLEYNTLSLFYAIQEFPMMSHL